MVQTLEELSNSQAETGEKIATLTRNYGKEGKQRRTPERLEEYLRKLTDLWDGFDTVDSEIRDNYPEEIDHEYFKKDYYEVIKQICEQARSNIRMCLAAHQEAAAASAEVREEKAKAAKVKTTESTITTNALTPLKRFQLLARIFKTSLNKCDISLNKTTPKLYTVKVQSLQRNWEDLTTAYQRLQDTATEAEIESYFELQEQLELKVSGMTSELEANPATQNQPTTNTAIKLPKIELPKFDGNYLHWPQFYDLFKQMIHDQPIAPAQKLYYLRANVTGDAHNLIQHFHTTDSNYEVAWSTLVERFSNKRLLLTAQINRLLQQTNTAGTANSIRKLHDTTKEVMQAIANLGYDTSSWDPLVVHLLLLKLDKDTRILFEQSLDSPRSAPELTQFLKFVEARFHTLEAISSREDKRNVAVLASSQRGVCEFCNEDSHKGFTCNKFLSLSVEERGKLVRKLQLCINCLKPGHYSPKCQSRGCKQCSGKHNTLLHFPSSQQRGSIQPIQKTPVDSGNEVGKSITHIGKGNEPTAGSSLNAALGLSVGNRQVYLATAVVNVVLSNGMRVPCRALLDSGSQLHFVTAALAQQLGIKRRRMEIPISGIGAKECQAEFEVEITIESTTSSYRSTIEASIMHKISDYQPMSESGMQSWRFPPNVQLADPSYAKANRIDMLLGADIFFDLLLPGELKVSDELPLLRNTKLGWIVAGSAIGTSPRSHCHPATTPTLSSLDKLVRKFWESESVEEQCRIFSEEEYKCEEHFQRTVAIKQNGQFMVELPFNHEPEHTLGDSLETAIKRFRTLERKLERNKELQEAYVQFMKEYEVLGHMTPLAEDKIPKSNFFLPHHCVLKPDSSSTKLRVVFDASAKSTSGYSLNDMLMVGPTVQPDIFSVITNFRLHRYVFTGDISKMYRQILVSPSDRAYQLIVWRSRLDSPLRIYQLNTITYGTASASYLATRCLVQLANKYQHIYPNAAKVILYNSYVDDCLTGAETIDEAKQLLNDTVSLLKRGNFELRKFCANDPDILKNIPVENREKMLALYQSEVIKTLGLIWDPTQDTFKFNFDTITFDSGKIHVSKRSVLADLAKFFDPLGLLGPVVLLGKLFLQELWKLKITWDETLPIEQSDKWLKYLSQMCLLKNLNIPRFVLADSVSEVEIHAFSDSSQNAFGACIYLRSVSGVGKISVQLLCSKSRVGPLKTTSIAQLELQGAVLMVELVQRLIKIIPKRIDKIYYYTDSTTVLAWIKSPSYTWETYIANRVAKIQAVSDIIQWHHVKGELNPADLISRGLGAEDLAKSKIWFKGPEFLEHPKSSWMTSEYNAPDQVPGFRKVKSVLTTSQQLNIENMLNHKNSFYTLQKIFAFCYRLFLKVKGRRMHEGGNLSVEEIQQGTIWIWRYVQIKSFPEEYWALREGKTLIKGSCIASLNPYFDEKTKLIRVGGRLRNALISADAKNQILLPKNSTITTLLLNHLHQKYMHASHRTLIAISRQQYWILSVGRETRKVLSSCVKCFRSKPRSIEQLMGHLPRERVEPSRPFYYAGVDFCGPVKTHYKVRGKIPTKSYLAVFVCFSTKAVHIEVVSDLTTEAFLNCLKRFVGRRGICHTIHCDNATNFVGARNQLKEFKDMFNASETQSRIDSSCLRLGIKWKHIPPRSPHFGGIWEAAVKSAKGLLVKYLGEASLTYEELSTVVVQIESILNSRPLTPMSSDPNDLEPLTPGHFLIGAPLTSLPEPDITERNITRLNKFYQIQHIQQHFWRKWSTEYLHLLQQRLKWKTQSPNLALGTMVLVKDINLPPMKWKIGRVTEIFKGKDGLVRVASVKTETGTYQRATNNLCPLPIEQDIKENLPETEASDSSAVHSNEIKEQMTKKSRSGRVMKGALLSTMLLVCSIIPEFTAQLGDEVKITKLDNAVGAYFEDLGTVGIINSYWSIYVYYNLTSYWQEFAQMRFHIKEMEEICRGNMTTELYCSPIITIFRHRIKVIEYNNELLHSLHAPTKGKPRVARSPFDFVGNIAYSLFGVLDQDYASHIENQVNSVSKNEQHLANLIRQQSSIADSTINIFKQKTLEIDQQFHTLNAYLAQTLNAIEKRQGATNLRERWNVLTSYMILVITNFERTQDVLLDVILNLKHARINPQFITPSQLNDQLQLIGNNLPPNLRIPKGSVLDMYKIATVKGRSLNGSIVFEMLIPLLDSQEFQLFHLITVSFTQRNITYCIKTTDTQVAVNLDRTRYFYLNEMDLMACKSLMPTQLLCRQLTPTRIHQTINNNCEMSLLNHENTALSSCVLEEIPTQDRWVRLKGGNGWFFSISKNLIAHLICHGITKGIVLWGTGIIEVRNLCALKLPNLVINGQATYNASAITNSFIPSANISDWTLPGNSITALTAPVESNINISDLFSLHNKINRIINESMIPGDMNIHDYHHYGLTYFILMILILVVFVYWYKHRPPKPLPRRNAPRFEVTV